MYREQGKAHWNGRELCLIEKGRFISFRLIQPAGMCDSRNDIGEQVTAYHLPGKWNGGLTGDRHKQTEDLFAFILMSLLF